MPRNSEFNSGLPRVAEFSSRAEPDNEPENFGEILRPKREQTDAAKAQQMWDTYQDIKNAWVDFVRESRQNRKDADKMAINLLDTNNPLSQEFHATPIFQKLHSRLRQLWQDEGARAAWKSEMQREAQQWADVNGSWEEYGKASAQISELEKYHGVLEKEKFAERGAPIKKRRRTLQTDLADIEMNLEEARAKADGLSKTSPELAAKILASELAQRRKELHSSEGFMWPKSRRKILEEVEKIVAEQETLRLIVLEGEAGSGKTTLAEMVARHLTGNSALHIEVGEKTKVDRALFADEKLEAGSSPTVYKPILYALTGKERPTDAAFKHQGRAVFVDEFNKISNDEGGVLATVLDRCRVGGKTGYHLLGANAEDVVQRNALVLAAQNPAGSRFRGRTDFTPEVKRKMTTIPVEYFPQTEHDPELFEMFLVAMQDPDGNMRAKAEEVGPYWQTIENKAEQTKQDKLETGEALGGALWRLSRMLHESYENLAHRPNTLTAGNSDAWIGGRVLPPGDILKWLKEYQKEVKKGVSLEHFLSQKFLNWLNSEFQSAADAGDKQLYLELAEKFNLVVEKAGAYEPLPLKKITPDFLNERQVAELSPRVPRPIIYEKSAPSVEAAAYKKIKFDFMGETGKKLKGVEARVDETGADGRYVKAGTEQPVYIVIGEIKECKKYPDLVGKIILAQDDKPEKKLVMVNLNEFEKKEIATEIFVQNATNPYREALLETGIPNIDTHPSVAEFRDFNVNLELIRANDISCYTADGLSTWADNLASVDFKKLTPEKRKIIEQEIKNGAIAIFMPDRATQLSTTVEDYTRRFSPIWIKDGKQKNIADAGWWGFFQELVNKKAKELVADVPNRPYLSLQKPTQKPDARTCGKTVVKQLEEYAKIQAERKKAKQAPVFITNPAEYGVLQRRFTEHIIINCPSPTDPVTLNPLDSNTFTRFINLSLSGGSVPGGFFVPGDSRLGWGGSDADYPYSGGGFRLSVRVEL